MGLAGARRAAGLEHVAEERAQRRPAVEVRAGDARAALQLARARRPVAPPRESFVVHVPHAERHGHNARHVDVYAKTW